MTEAPGIWLVISLLSFPEDFIKVNSIKGFQVLLYLRVGGGTTCDFSPFLH